MSRQRADDDVDARVLTLVRQLERAEREIRSLRTSNDILRRLTVWGGRQARPADPYEGRGRAQAER
jgi:hypothetical protein